MPQGSAPQPFFVQSSGSDRLTSTAELEGLVSCGLMNHVTVAWLSKDLASPEPWHFLAQNGLDSLAAEMGLLHIICSVPDSSLLTHPQKPFLFFFSVTVLRTASGMEEHSPDESRASYHLLLAQEDSGLVPSLSGLAQDI